jgi:hypothetical protein
MAQPDGSAQCGPSRSPRIVARRPRFPDRRVGILRWRTVTGRATGESGTDGMSLTAGCGAGQDAEPGAERMRSGAGCGTDAERGRVRNGCGTDAERSRSRMRNGCGTEPDAERSGAGCGTDAERSRMRNGCGTDAERSRMRNGCAHPPVRTRSSVSHVETELDDPGDPALIRPSALCGCPRLSWLVSLETPSPPYGNQLA